MNDKLNMLKKELELYKFFTNGRVQFSEVDSYNVVHNVQFFYWIEWSRTEYFRNLGLDMRPERLIKTFPFMIVHTEMDYFNPARYGDVYKVLTRITKVKNSSVYFNNIIQLADGTILVKNSSILVYLNLKENKAIRVPDELRKLLIDFEKSDIEFID